jgi:hypothetical protein
MPSEAGQKMPGKRDKPEMTIANLRQVEVVQAREQSIADAVCHIDVTKQI